MKKTKFKVVVTNLMTMEVEKELVADSKYAAKKSRNAIQRNYNPLHYSLKVVPVC